VTETEDESVHSLDNRYTILLAISSGQVCKAYILLWDVSLNAIFSFK